MKEITINVSVGSCLEDGVGEEGGPNELMLCAYMVLTQVESL